MLVRRITSTINRYQSSSSSWKRRHVSDVYARMATDNEHRARSYYKLEEMMSQQHDLITKGDFIIDLGAAPGGWTLCAASRLFPPTNTTRNDSLLIGVDLLPIDSIPNAILLQGDFTKTETQNEIMTKSNNRLADTILSDMLQNMSGIHSTDHQRSLELCFSVLDFSRTNLVVNGHVLCKFLRGSDDKELLSAAKDMFHQVKVIKPSASRQESREIYLCCLKKK